MVLPLIPVALIAVGAITGSGGLALGGKGAWDLKKAQEEFGKSKCDYERRRKRSEARVKLTNKRLEQLGEQQKQALTDVVIRMTEFMRRNKKKIKENERLLIEGLDAELNAVPNMERLEFEAAAWIKAVVGSVGAGAATNMGVTAAATAFGTAGTGAAIAGLSGVAAENAMLAFLGGGTLAAGGGGMALGAAALNAVVIGPALLVGGFVAKGQGEKQITRAREFTKTVAEEVAKMDVFDAGLEAIESRIAEIKSLLAALGDRATTALDDLESVPFEPEVDASGFQRAMGLVLAVRDVAAAPIVDTDGNLTADSEKMKVKYRRMTENDES
ncbi:hypothetical protein A5667_03675 [Mycolicibacterium fortuitum]|uniref:hypothetical protein n=1 Tax=Mycolicibacterium fortuitum TaxID=1766 RepID=UPI0007EE0338|nr:hypothetical protein [Mycolicibacterium fortuitum]OBI55433.1 hypothetical protein A5667_03675 [Mycolicibacterium fortuitum]